MDEVRDEDDENIAGELTGRKREDIGQAGRVDEERDVEDENIAGKVAG